MTPWFAGLAGLLLVGAIAVVVWPLWRRGGSPRANRAVLLLICGLPLCAVVLYRAWSNFNWAEPAPAVDSPANMVARLARRLEREPQDVDGWKLLGQSYLVLGQNPQAARAFQRADRLRNGADADAVLGWAEALFRDDEAEIEGRAGRLFERALTLDPTSVKANLFAAIAAQRRGELQLARDRFTKVLGAAPPEELRTAIQAQLAQLDRTLGGGSTAVSGTAKVMVTIKLGRKWQAAQFAQTPLFVLVRRPGQPGPPLAAKKLAAVFPQQVELTSADAMLPGSEITAGETVEVVARLAAGGTPTPAAGDPFGIIQYKVGQDARREIVIDQISPSR